MENLSLIEKIKLMPVEYQQQVEDYVDFLIERRINVQSGKWRVPGLLKGKMWMSPDFDYPLKLVEDVDSPTE